MLKSLAVLPAALALVLLAACGQEPPAETASAPPAPAASEAAPAASEPATPAHPAIAKAEGEFDLSGIAPAEGGQTVAQVYAAKDELAGQTVLVRGKVVKVNAGIMDRNWLHVRDGSGDEGTNDLTITTAAVPPAVGETVLVSGALSLNRDFGMGYVYPVIVEDAEVTVE